MRVLDLERQYRFLDALPDTLYETVITTRHGVLGDRVQGILQWRESLLNGRLPDPDKLVWPETLISKKLIRRIDALELTVLCKDEESLVDHILKDICRAVDSVDEWRERGLEHQFTDSLQQNRRQRNTPTQLEQQAASEGPVPEPVNEGDDSKPSTVGGEENEGGRKQVAGESYREGHSFQETGSSQQTHLEAPELPSLLVEPHHSETVIDTLERDWCQLQTRWTALQETVQGMATRLGRGWDLSQGILVSEGWQKFVRLRRWIKNHPELIAMVDSLGRDQIIEGTGPVESVTDTTKSIDTKMQHRARKAIRTESPLSTHGVSRSDDIARMLPQEALYLGHKKLHLLWHARRAEQALLCYQVEGVLSEHQPELAAAVEIDRQKRKKSTLKKGPILLCLDTSASMHGKPEHMAKAICLEVVRLASLQQRACQLFAFSGPGQVLSQTLAFSPKGLKDIIRFLQQSFHGGTDIQGPLKLAVDTLREHGWQKADMLLISDGRFPVQDQLAKQFENEKRKAGLRVKGIMVGTWSAKSMKALCEQVIHFR